MDEEITLENLERMFELLNKTHRVSRIIILDDGTKITLFDDDRYKTE